MSAPKHLGLGLVTCGLWLILAPMIFWIRGGRYGWAGIWVGAWALAIVIGVLPGGAETDTVVAEAGTPAPTSQVQGLLGDPRSAASTVTPPTTAAPIAASPTRVAPTSRPRTTRPDTPELRTSTRAASAAGTRRPTSQRTATQQTTKPRTSSAAPRTDPRFATCKAAKAAGYGPYRAGQDPEYDWYRDADKDGIVCE